MSIVIRIEDLWKEYRLGVIGHGTLTKDLQSWWAKKRGKEDPNLKIASLQDSAQNMTKKDSFWALRGIELSIKKGDTFGIIGNNGAGKSTLLKILSRVTAPTRGHIKIKGRIASLLEVGTGFHPELTGKENIYMNGAILGMDRSEIKQKIDEIVDFSGVEQFINTPVKRYSSGMYVRLAFAIAAHLEPEILVVDEVLAVGDADFQKKCLGKMGEVASEGRTILFVSHNMASMSALCNKGILLKNGIVNNIGDIHEIIDKHMMRPNNSLVFGEQVDRKGDGKLCFASAEVYADASEKQRQIVSGGDLHIKLFMKTNIINLSAEDVTIDLRIDNLLGNRLIWMSTSMIDSWDFDDNSIVFHIKNNPLNEGTYSVTLYCKLNGQVSDWIQGAFNFNVKNLNINKNGKIVDPAQSPLLIQYDIA